MEKTIKKFELKTLQTDLPAKQITSTKEAVEFVSKFYGDDINIFESLFILMLNSKNETTGYAKISQGGICGTVVDIRLILKYAIDSLAVRVILVHNHPSGNENPSIEDLEQTKRIHKALKLVDIELIDHLIITENKFKSILN